MGSNQPITIADGFFRGEDKTIRFTIVDDQDPAVAVDVTGWNLEWNLQLEDISTTNVLVKTSPVGINIFDAINGVVDVIFAAADLATQTRGDYFHSLRRTDPGSEAVLAEGEFKLRAA